MSTVSTGIRAVHLLSNAAWFGGSLAGAVGLNAAAAAKSTDAQKLRAAAEGWARWSPVQTGSIVVHLTSGAGIVWDNRRRVSVHRPTQIATILKTGVTIAALGVTVANRRWGQQVGREGRMGDPSDPLRPQDAPSQSAATAQRRLQFGQWVLPALTGIMLVADAYLGEKQRSVAGLLDRTASGH